MDLDESEIYQLRFWLNKVSPFIWRRFLVKSKSSVADLHHLIQVSMGFDNTHLHQFIIQGKFYGISYIGGMSFTDDPYAITLKDLQLRIKERFFYKYNFHITWEIEIRLEKILPNNLKKAYPICIGGNNAAPLENYDGPIDFMERQPTNFITSMDALLNHLGNEIIKAKTEGVVNTSIKNKAIELIDLVNTNRFNRKNLNNKLLAYIKGTLNLEDLIENEEVFLCG